MNTRVCMCLLSLLLCIQLHAAKKQEVLSKHWVAQYKGNGTLSVLEGYIIRPKLIFDGGGVFTRFSYSYEPRSEHIFGMSNAIAVFLVENSDEKGVLKVKPRKGVESYSQLFQIVGSNSHFKSIKTSIAKDNAYLSFNLNLAVFIDGNVRSFISTIPLMTARMYFRNVERFTVPDVYASQIEAGYPSHIIQNGYVDRYGDSNSVLLYTEGTIGKITVKNAILDSSIHAGADDFNAFTKDLAGLYSTYPPTGTIGSLKARLIAGSGKLTSFWVSTTTIAASSRPKMKVASGQVVTENTSVFITP